MIYSQSSCYLSLICCGPKSKRRLTVSDYYIPRAMNLELQYSHLREAVIETKLESISGNIVPLWHSFIRKRKQFLGQNQISFFPVLLTSLRTFKIFFNWNIIPTLIRCCIYLKNLHVNMGYSTYFAMLLHNSMAYKDKRS